MCEVLKTDKMEGKNKLEKTIRRHRITLVFIALLIMVLTFSFPAIQQTRIHIEIKLNKISDVSVETSQVSLISTIIASPKQTGVNTINITILNANFTSGLENVPDGEYVIVWIPNGIPSSGNYTIEVKLIKNDIMIDTFDLEASF